MKSFNRHSDKYLSYYLKNLFALLTIALLILVVYSNTFHASWHLDDGPNILENRRMHLKDIRWPDLKGAIFSSPKLTIDLTTLRPLSRLSLALNYYFGKDEVFGYHMVNITIHIAASLFLFLFILHTLHLPLFRAKYGPNACFIAFLATIFWAINPIQSQAVTYIVQRMTSMAGMFYIMSMYFYSKGRRADKGFRKAMFLIFCTICGLLSLSSKENAVMLPVSLMAYDLFIIQGFTKVNLRKTFRIFLIAYVLPLIVGLVLFTILGGTLSSLFSIYEIRPFTIWERLLTESRILVFYISLILYPIPGRLSIDHDIIVSNSFFDPLTTILSILLISGMIAGSLYLSKRQPLIAFSVLFFFINHLMESTILPLELIFEHRNYTPSMFLFLPIAIGLMNALSHYSHKRFMQRTIVLFIILLIVGEGHATFIRNIAWKNEEHLWLDCLEKYPGSFRAHHNLGKYYQIHNMDKMAFYEYGRALKSKEIHSKKEKGMTFFNLGILAAKYEKYENAEKFYRKALTFDPCFPGVHNNLAILIGRDLKNMDRVQAELTAAIHCGHDSEIPMAYTNLGILLMKMGRPDEAIQALKKALDMNPDNTLALKRLGYVYKGMGNRDQATIYFKRALKYYPGDMSSLLFLYEIYLQSGDKDRAWDGILRLINTIPPDVIVSFFDRTGKNRGVFEITPDPGILSPLIYDAYNKIRRGKNRYPSPDLKR